MSERYPTKYDFSDINTAQLSLSELKAIFDFAKEMRAFWQENDEFGDEDQYWCAVRDKCEYELTERIEKMFPEVSATSHT